VVPLGATPEWYRYHHLLRDVLRHRLTLENPTSVPELHRRAARWFAAHQSIPEALGHAVAARDWSYVAQMVITQAAPLILSANPSALMRLLGEVPPEELSSTAERMVCAALLLFHAGDYDAIPDCLQGARALLRSRPQDSRLPVEIALRALQVCAYRVVGDMPALVGEATRLLADAADPRFAQLPSLVQYRAIGLDGKGTALFWTDRLDLADRYLWAASTAARAAGVEPVEISATGHRALLEVMRGSVREAARLAGEALGMAERWGWLHAPQSLAAYLALALVHVERDEITEAVGALQRGHRALRGETAALRMIWWGAQCRVALARGEVTRARALLDDARRQRDPRMRAPAVDRWLLLVESQADLMTDRPERVEARYATLARVDELTVAEQVCRARAAFAMGNLQWAHTLLPGSPAVTSETVATVAARILTALIADARGQRAHATVSIAAAVALAQVEGISQPFVALASDRLAGLIRRGEVDTPQNRDFVTRVGVAIAGVSAGASPSSPAGNLSEREAEVLHYLPTMLTAGEIAVELGVSVNTVKAHLRSIYRKLEVTRRRQAVVRAHEQGLL
jgi:LuxR family maltose regulon positive regulatory protein